MKKGKSKRELNRVQHTTPVVSSLLSSSSSSTTTTTTTSSSSSFPTPVLDNIIATDRVAHMRKTMNNYIRSKNPSMSEEEIHKRVESHVHTYFPSAPSIPYTNPGLKMLQLKIDLIRAGGYFLSMNVSNVESMVQAVQIRHWPSQEEYKGMSDDGRSQVYARKMWADQGNRLATMTEDELKAMKAKRDEQRTRAVNDSVTWRNLADATKIKLETKGKEVQDHNAAAQLLATSAA